MFCNLTIINIPIIIQWVIYKLNGSKCEEIICPSNCKKCTSEDVCVECSEGYESNKDENTKLESEHARLLQSIKDARKIISDIENNEFGYKLSGVNDKEKNLILILEEIADKYSFIAEDIRAISWKRVWLPRIQSIVKECNADGVMGIYKITIKNIFHFIIY